MSFYLHLHTQDSFTGSVELQKPDARQPLYASFPLSGISEDALANWAARNGLSLAYAPHITVAYSKTPINQDRLPVMSAGMVVPPGGRSIEKFGDALVLCVDCPQLQARHAEYKKIGASWDYPNYRPHVTLGYGAGDLYTIFDQIEPFDEPITLMGERREAIVEDWAESAAHSYPT